MSADIDLNSEYLCGLSDRRLHSVQGFAETTRTIDPERESVGIASTIHAEQSASPISEKRDMLQSSMESRAALTRMEDRLRHQTQEQLRIADVTIEEK